MCIDRVFEGIGFPSRDVYVATLMHKPNASVEAGDAWALVMCDALASEARSGRSSCKESPVSPAPDGENAGGCRRTGRIAAAIKGVPYNPKS